MGGGAGGFGRGMVLLAAANAAYIVTAYVVTMVTARLLDPAEFGAFGVLMGWITLLTALLVKGLATSVTREMASGDSAQQARAWRAGAGVGARLSAGLAVVGVAAAPLLVLLLGDGGAGSMAGGATLDAIAALGALTFGVNAVIIA